MRQAGLIGTVLLVIFAGAGAAILYTNSQAAQGALQSQVGSLQAEKNDLSNRLSAAQADANATRLQVNALSTRVAELENQANPASSPKPAEAKAQWKSFQSELDKTVQNYFLVAPAALSPGKHALVLYFHSLGHQGDEVQSFKAGQDTLINVLMRREVIVAAPAYRGDSWLNPAATADVTQLIRALQRDYSIGPIVLAGYSMGGTAALIYPLVAPKDIPIAGIVAANFASDVSDLFNEGRNAQVKESVRAAYGGTPSERPGVYEERSLLRNLIQLPATLPVALYASYSDSMIGPIQQTRLRDALAARGQPLFYTVIPGDHKVEGLDEGLAFVLNRAGSP